MDDDLLFDSDLSDVFSDAALDLTLLMLSPRRRQLLSEARARSLPMVYTLWVGRSAGYVEDWPVYCGSSDDGRRRLNEHVGVWGDAVGIDLAQVKVSFMYTDTTGIALWAEHAILRSLSPVMNVVVPGAGCKHRGAVRERGCPTPFRILHPRRGDPVDVAAQMALRRRVVAHLNHTVPPAWILDQLN